MVSTQLKRKKRFSVCVVRLDNSERIAQTRGSVGVVTVAHSKSKHFDTRTTAIGSGQDGQQSWSA